MSFANALEGDRGDAFCGRFGGGERTLDVSMDPPGGGDFTRSISGLSSWYGAKFIAMCTSCFKFQTIVSRDLTFVREVNAKSWAVLARLLRIKGRVKLLYHRFRREE